MQSTGREGLKKEQDSRQDAAGADSEATSKETLSDLEESEESVELSSSGPDSGPSPDGVLDDGDKSNEAGPM
jgi:hypothetical protein